MNIGRTALIIVSFILILSVGLAGGAAYVYFFNTSIIKSPLVKNETKLKEYLGIDGVFSKLLKYKTDSGRYIKVSLIMFFPYNEWKETNNCTGTRGSERIFCFDEFLNNGQMTINIYPNLNQILQEDPETVNRLLNLNILVIFENRLGINPSKKKLILTENTNDFVFIW